ncbi:MAG: hypothetical protein PHE43_04665 [Candidatus Nanoarchaeia archaeon]|nr:hypothetical protein [Candidatus Nanoarchaeia archaeon]
MTIKKEIEFFLKDVELKLKESKNRTRKINVEINDLVKRVEKTNKELWGLL